MWGKFPADLKVLGLPDTFPGSGFEHLARAERVVALAAAFRVPANTVHVQFGRWRESVRTLRFVRALAARCRVGRRSRRRPDHSPPVLA